MIENLHNKFLASSGISTDTRSISPGNLFFALKGPNFNANAMAKKAIESGASYAVIDEAEFVVGDRYILVDNVLVTLQKLANYHRRLFQIPVLGITGSNGKTTTKELIFHVLSKKFRILATRGNLNNHIGVPLTILRITRDTEIAIIEMGANKVGDIKELCKIAEPDHGIITNIGKAHIEGFGGIEGVIRGKSELYDWLIKHDGKVFINSTDPILSNMAKRFNSPPVFYPGINDFYSLELVHTNPFVSCRTREGKEFETKLIGKYNFFNIATALCIGRYFKVPEEEAILSVRSYEPDNNRSQIIRRGLNTIILDAYNANPSSMEAALQNLAAMPAKRRVVILGDMLELGEQSIEEHEKLGKIVSSLNFDQVFFCGERMRAAHSVLKSSEYAKNLNELEILIKNSIFKDSLILIKGSRAMQLEIISDLIK